EIKRALPGELGLVGKRDLNLVGKAFFAPRMVAGIGQEIGLAHIEIQIDRIERDERREQCGWAGRGTAAGDQVADGDEMSADAPGEGRGDTAVPETDLGVTDLSRGVVNGGLRGSPFGRPLIDGLFRSERFRRQYLSAIKFATSEREPRACCLTQGIGLCEPDFVGARVDGEEEIALLDDVPIFKVYSGQRAADLRAKLELLDRGKLTKEAQSGIDLTHERLPYHDLRKGRGSSSGGPVALMIRIG